VGEGGGASEGGRGLHTPQERERTQRVALPADAIERPVVSECVTAETMSP
jgi:hypothetical protein